MNETLLPVQLAGEAVHLRVHNVVGRAVFRSVLFYGALLAHCGFLSHGVAKAADAQTYNTSVGALEAPVVQTIDQNGVDLTTGMLRLQSPALTVGSGDDTFVFGLEWMGRAWRFIGIPTISRDGTKYFVSYDGQTYEFNGYSSGFSERNPVRGTSLNCSIVLPQNVIDFCIFIGRHGEVVYFDADLLLGPQSPDIGYESYGLGNLGVKQTVVYAPAHDSVATTLADPNGDPYFGHMTYAGSGQIGYGYDMHYNAPNKKLFLNDQSLSISTPNLSLTDSSDHYLLPQSVTQVITNDMGMQWKYYVNSDREIYRYDQPGGIASINYTYDGDHRVSSIATADGTWDYSFDTSGNIRTVIVTSPSGRQIRVRSHKELGYVTEYAEGSLGTSGERKTTYTYDSGERLIQVTYPELNYDTFEYDTRGNITKKRSYPKPSNSSDPVLLWQAEYPSTCVDRVLCNSPISTTDPENRVTEFEYAPTIQIQRAGSATETYAYGDPRPSTIRYPETGASDPRKEERFEYAYGRVTQVSTCISTENCVGSTDEVRVTEAHTKIKINASVSALVNGTWISSGALVRGGTMVNYSETVSGGGDTRVTCKSLDQRGRVVTVTPPQGQSWCASDSSVVPQPVTANSPESAQTKSAPTFSQ